MDRRISTWLVASTRPLQPIRGLSRQTISSGTSSCNQRSRIPRGLLWHLRTPGVIAQPHTLPPSMYLEVRLLTAPQLCPGSSPHATCASSPSNDVSQPDSVCHVAQIRHKHTDPPGTGSSPVIRLRSPLPARGWPRRNTFLSCECRMGILTLRVAPGCRYARPSKTPLLSNAYSVKHTQLRDGARWT